jgi:two-component system, OmpR family, KDP operon response regulator KdpE
MAHGSILVLENDTQIRCLVKTVLGAQGFEVASARDIDEAICFIHSTNFDLLLLDSDVLNTMDIRICQEIRALSSMGIILLSASAAEQDKVAALEAGADDYVTKPFDTPELLARVRAVLRRSAARSGHECRSLRLGDLEIDFDKRCIRVGKREERLTPKEFAVMRYIAKHPNRTVGHRELLQAVWGSDYRRGEQRLRGCINRLRKKLEASPNRPKYLVTVPWVGYHFELPD